jgi:hypothetical protein
MNPNAAASEPLRACILPQPWRVLPSHYSRFIVDRVPSAGVRYRPTRWASFRGRYWPRV